MNKCVIFVLLNLSLAAYGIEPNGSSATAGVAVTDVYSRFEQIEKLGSGMPTSVPESVPGVTPNSEKVRLPASSKSEEVVLVPAAPVKMIICPNENI